MSESFRERWLSRYQEQVGRPRGEITTPALLLDLDVARRNIALMARQAVELGVGHRPHIKVHKSPELARLQVAAGALGVTCATVWEAVVMSKARGIEDVLVSSQVAGEDKLRAVTALGRDHRITLAVDDAENIGQLSRAAVSAGSELELLIDVDVGMRRAGVRTAAEALALADVISKLPAVRLRGVQGYEGGNPAEGGPEARQAAIRQANQVLVDVVVALADNGHVCEVVSAGGTGTYAITGANPQITEVQAGSYVVMDCFHERFLPGVFEVALTVLGSVVSRHGSTITLDCGRKAVSTDFDIPPLVDHPEATVRAFAEEHCLVDFDGTPALARGDTAEVMVSYAPTAVNLHDVFHVIEGGVVTGIWPVNPRGSGPPAFL